MALFFDLLPAVFVALLAFLPLGIIIVLCKKEKL